MSGAAKIHDKDEQSTINAILIIGNPAPIGAPELALTRGTDVSIVYFAT